MSQLIVISAIGTDRTGVVQDVTKAILSCGGNIEESRMTTLGSEFAMLLLVSGNWATLSKLEKKLQKLGENGDLNVSIRQTDAKRPTGDRMPYAVDIVALDQQGIVFNLANFFALPILIGCGVDGGVHVLHRYREADCVEEVGRTTASAVTLSFITTIAGFGSLSIAHHRGVESLGTLMVLGCVTVLAATVLFLPAPA